MASRDSGLSVSQLWQLPLLVMSLALFGYAAYLLWDPKPGPTIDTRISSAAALLKHERPEAAVASLKSLIALDKLTAGQQGRIHLLLAESLEMFQQQKHEVYPALQQMILEQIRLAVANGAELTAPDYRRSGQANELLGKTGLALEDYRRSARLDADHSLRLSKKIAQMLLDTDDAPAADAALQDYLKGDGVTDSERAWALGERARLLGDRGQYTEARILLDSALKLSAQPMETGQFNYGIGYLAWKSGNGEEAERYLRVARDQLKLKHPKDADACLLLGKIYQSRNDPETAVSFYNTVLTSHPSSKVAPLALLGRGTCRAMMGQDDPAMVDLIGIAKRADAGLLRPADREEIVEGLDKAAQLLSAKKNHAAAIELMAYEQTLVPTPNADFYLRLARLYESRADQVEASLVDATPAERLKRERLTDDLRTKAADGFVAYSQKLTLTDDRSYGSALWHGIDLYEQANNAPAAVAAMELYSAERPEDPLTPEALLRLGKAYQSLGQLDKAIATFQRNQFRYPKSLAAAKSAVPLARAFIAQGPTAYARAESTLVGVLDNNPLLDPASEDFRESLFNLGQLYHRTGRFEEAIARLEEFTKRYPKDVRTGELLFLTADSYSKSAGQLSAKLATASTSDEAPVDPAEVETARKKRLTRAKELFDKVVELYRTVPPKTEAEKLYFKLSHFYRADCAYDLGDYNTAINLYDNAAFRFQDDPSSLAAYVQIVNSWCRLGNTEKAKAANERAKWLLRRMPPEAFADGTFSMPKQYWEQWLKWTNDSGMW